METSYLKTLELDNAHISNLFGQFDCYLKKLERSFGTQIIDRDGTVHIRGEQSAVAHTAAVFTELQELARRGNQIQEQNVDYAIAMHMENQENIYLAQAYCYSHSYASDEMNIEQEVIEKSTGVLLIRELPDTVKLKETEAEAYSAVWDLMIELEKNLPMAYVFYGQDSLVEHNERYDEIGIFLPNSLFLKNLERHVAKAEEIIYTKK